MNLGAKNKVKKTEQALITLKTLEAMVLYIQPISPEGPSHYKEI